MTPQRLVFSYHKTGTSLFLAVMNKVAERLGLRVVTQYGLVTQIDPDADIVLLAHSLIEALPTRPFRAIRVVRDPRDIWVSGYLYHRRTGEGWCVNTDFDPTPPIDYPRVDFSFQHQPEAWKRAYLAGLNGKSYQQNLLDRDQADGLAFELAGYTGCTLEAMRGWRWPPLAVPDIKLETIMSGYDAAMQGIFRHLGFAPAEVEAAVEMAASEDMGRMGDDGIAARPQIHSRSVSKWRDVLSAVQVAEFEASYSDVITRLGYALSAPE
jgi:hypothetical protein